MAQNLITKHIIEAVVKPTLDKGEREKLNADLGRIFADASNIDFNTKETRESLNSLAKAFQAIFAKAGDNSIDFEKLIKMPSPDVFAKLGEVAAKQFWSAWESVAKGVGGNVTQDMMREQFNQLEKQREQLLKRQKVLSKRLPQYERLSDVPYMEQSEFRALSKEELGSLGKDVTKIASEMYEELKASQKKLGELQGGTKEFNQALLDFYAKAHKTFRMSRTLSQSPDLISDKSVLQNYDWKNLQKVFNNEDDERSSLQSYNNVFSSFIEKEQSFFDSIPAKLQRIDNQLKKMQNDGVGVIDIEQSKNGLKTLNEIEETYKRIRVAQGERIDDRQVKHIQSAIDFDPTKSGEGIKTLYEQYQKAAASGNWVEEYRALLKYVKLYESYLTTANKAHSNKITKRGNPFSPLYEQLKPMAENAQNMLQNILNMGEGKPLVGMGGSEKDKIGDTSTEAANAEKVAEAKQTTAEEEAKARAEVEAKAKAEKEKEESLKRQRIEEEKIAKAQEKAAAARKEELGLMQAMEKFQSEYEKTDKSNEALAFINSKTGNMSELFVGDPHGVTMDPGTSRKMSELGYDTEVHSHSWKTAAPSIDDFEAWFKQLEHIKKFGIRAGEELLTFDFSKLDPSKLQEIIQKYKDLDNKLSAQIQSMSFDEQKEKFGSYQGRQEAVQVMLRQGLEEILRDVPGVMKSIQMPELPVADIVETQKKTTRVSLADEYERANDEVKELIKNLAILYKNMDPNVDPGDGFDPIADAEEKLSKIAPELLGADMDQWDKLGQKLIDEQNTVQQEDVVTEQHIQSYEQLCKVVEKYNHLVAQGGIKSPADMDSYDDVADSLDGVISEDQLNKFGETLDVNTLAQQLGIEIPQAAQNAERAVDELNESLEKTQQLASGGGAGSGVGDASSSELEAERARAESLQNEIEQKNSALNAANEEKQALQNDLDATRQQLEDSEHEKSLYDSAMNKIEEESNAKDREIYDLREQLANDGDALFTAEQRANEAEERASQLERKLAESFDGENKQGSVNTEELKTLLNSIVYNVKIVHDDNDKTANKIALDDSTLESTLTKVFANILKPKTQQNDSGQKQAPWALENTLNTIIKGILEKIQANTAGIDDKIAKGGVVTPKDAETKETGSKSPTGRVTALKSLVKDYERLAKLSAQFKEDGNLETKATIDNLKDEIRIKRDSLKLTMDENQALREKYANASKAEKRLLAAEKAQKKIDDQRKAADKDAKQQAKDVETEWKKRVKDAKRATGINAATSAANAGDQTVLRAIGIEGVSKDIENKAKELSDQINALRVLRDEIDKKGNDASEQDRDNLSKQIAKVKDLKTEVDGYLKIHEKYSGEGVIDLGDASNFGAVGTDQYWNNITAAIKNASTGKTTIKGLNADTGELTGTTKIAANTFATWSATVDPLTGRLSMLRTGIKKTETIVEQITRKTKEIFTYFSGSSIIFKVFNELKKGVQYVRDIDLALTELKKVTDETEETYRKFLDTAAKTADKVGSTIQKVVSSTADWARLGYSMSEAAKFAETTQILMNVSEFTDVNQATDALISSVQAFGYTAETSMDVVDVLNTIGNNYAISTADLAKSLTKSSASLVAAGGNLAEAAALTATANAIIQDADSVGTALKTTSLRLRGTSVKVLEEEGLDSDGAIESTSKLRSQVLATSGVDILTDTGAYKSTYQILLEIAEVWDQITDDKARAGLLELLAGKRNSSVIAALLQNPEQLKDAYEDAMNAEGSALKENEKYLDSIQGKIDQFTNATQSMWRNFINSDVIKFVVELGTKLVKVAGSLGLFGTAILIFAGSKFIPWVLTAATGMGTFGESLKYVGLMMTSVNGTGAALIPTIVAQTKALWAGAAGANVFSLSLQTVGIAFQALMATPLGWLLAAVAAIAAVVAIADLCYKSTKELKEELSELKSELSDIRSELESVNSELETTNERMAELLAKDKLTFEEQEELDRLRATNDELERRKDLLETEEETKARDTGRKAAEIVNKTRSETLDDGWRLSIYSAEKDILRKIDKYKETKSKVDNASSLKEQEKYQKKLDKQEATIDEYIAGLSEALDGVEYGDSKESDEALDYLAELQDTYGIARGSANAKTNAIKGLFNKDEFAETKTAIDGYVDALAKGDTDAKKSIEDIIKNNKDLVQDLEARGLEAQDAIDYFTKLGSEANYATLDGKIKEVSKAATNFQNLINGGLFKVDGIDIGLADLFDEEGKIIQTKLSQVFQDTSDQTREDITHLLEGSYDQIKNGTVDTERLLTGFGLKTAQQILEIQNKVLGEQNLELFPNLKEEIDGIIDKFNEFSTAVGSVVDALDTLEQARAEEAYSGSISIETLENLMKYTDDYAQLVEIDETGAIRLSADAEKILIEQRIEKIKTDAAAAVQTAQSNLEQAKYNAKAVNETGPVQEALTAATDGLAGAWAYLGSIIGDIKDGNFSGMFERASAAYGNVTAGREEKRTQVNVSVEDAEKALENALNQQKIANALTSGNIKSKYSSEEASGGNKTKEDVEKSALEKLMEEFQREMDYWENRIGANQARYEQLQNEIDLLEAKGQKADASFYEDQLRLTEERRKLLEGEDGKGGQKGAALAYLKELEAAGKKGSEEWWEVANTLNDIEGELDDVTASIVDLQDAIGEIDTYKFEEFNTRLDNITSKLGTIRDLIAPDGEENWFDDQGEWTEEGVAVLGTYIQELETYKNGLAEVNAEREKYNKSYRGNEGYYVSLGIHSEQEYYDKVQELEEQQYDYIQSISDTEQSVVDMYESSIDAVEEYVDTLIDGYNDYIDSVKEALDAERDLYDFKKNVQKQAKDISEIERRIASLSGSTNKSDIAERRKLEAQLYESRESLNDTYYDHAKESQQNALDSEAEAYEENMTKFVEGLRVSLETATLNMDEFLMGVTSMVMYNADTVLAKYEETNLPLTKELTNPWEEAKKAVGSYSGNALDLMNQWTKEGGFFAQFNATGTTNLKSPWSAGTTAANSFKNSVDGVMQSVVSNIATNVQTASGELSRLYQQILDTAQKAAEVDLNGGGSGGGGSGGGNGSGGGGTPTKTVSATAYLTISGTEYSATGTGTTTSDAKEAATGNVLQKAYNSYKAKGYDDAWIDKRYSTWKKNVTFFKQIGNTGTARTAGSSGRYTMYAKGTTGTSRDEWAITDEPQFGDELVLVPGKDGNLSFMRKGTGVVPADLAANLMEWGKFSPDAMNVGGGVNVNMINNAVNKPEINLSFEALVKAERIDENTLPEVKKFVQQEINTLVKQMNYAIKGKGGR